jgi:phosphatidylserine decarboxylase
LSPADGKVVSIVRTKEDRVLKAEAQRVSVFMSPLNVHVNRSPVSGRVDSVVYNKGKFLTANFRSIAGR